MLVVRYLARRPWLRSFGSSKYPAHQVLPMPALSPTMTQGNIGEWKKAVGERVKPGDVLVEIETDKATMDFECQEEGWLAKQLQPAGTKDFEVGKPLAVLCEKKDDVKAFADFQITLPVEKTEATTAPPSIATPKLEVSPTATKLQTTQLADTAPMQGTRVIATPLAKATAKESGVDLSMIKGSGPGGRIVKADVIAQPITSSKQAYVDVPLTQMRKVIAQRLSESKQSIPHYYLTTTINMDRIVKLRSELNALAKEGEYRLSLNDFIVKAAAQTLRSIPTVNVSWQGSFVRQYQTVDVCVAVATEAGLITPIIPDADQKGLATISREMKDLAALAKQSRLQPHQYQGGSFTISNLGMYGVEHFTAIINPPQACILAVGATQLRPTIGDEGSVTASNQMTVTLSCDHRVVDGALGAQWLAKFKAFLEDPPTMLL